MTLLVTMSLIFQDKCEIFNAYLE